MSLKKIFNIAVVGRGMLGTSAAKHLSELGTSVIILGPNEPKINSKHKGVFGSHYDSGRITRILDRNPYYAKISSASISRYRELEKISGINFFNNVGQLTVAEIDPYLNELKNCAIENSLNHLILDEKELQYHFPYLNFKKGMNGIYEKQTAGYIDPRKFIQAQCKALKILGGKIIEDTVVKIENNNETYTIVTESKEKYFCKKVLIATGSFANHLKIIPKNVSIDIAEHTIILGEISNNSSNFLSGMPSIIYNKTEGIKGSVYVMPPIKYPDGRIWIKIGQSRGHIMKNPEKNLISWFQSDGDIEIAKWLKYELSKILPKIEFLSIQSKSCVTSKSKSGYQFIDKFDDTEIYSCLVGDGQAAKSADEIGRIAANNILYGKIPDEYDKINFQNEYL